ncbi:MAG: tRNA (adenosine(37)-N6)-threonylcarbamoyltransferase complex dimerization subunit type 1 TsaB [Syntrophomonadaceae bacterium]
MLILAIDSATPVAGVALLNDHTLLREDFVNYRKTHSETLMPMIDKVLRDCECTLQDVSALAVTTGPGSFTGLRIGLATIKGLSLASQIPVIGISTLEVIAHNIIATEALVCPLLDARKQEVYTAIYDATGSVPVRLTAEVACSPQEFADMALATANEQDRKKLILLGDGYYPYQAFFQEKLGEWLQDVPSHLMLPRAAAMGSLARKKYNRKEFEDVFALSPRYIRLSEAEYRLGKGAR